jgi:hypothetical protein
MSATLTELPSEPDPAPSTLEPTTTTPPPAPTTDDPADTTSDDTGDPPQSADPGCGCRAQAPTAPLLALLPLLLHRRRRAR